MSNTTQSYIVGVVYTVIVPDEAQMVYTLDIVQWPVKSSIMNAPSLLPSFLHKFRETAKHTYS